jgi:hypothetical protein
MRIRIDAISLSQLCRTEEFDDYLGNLWFTIKTTTSGKSYICEGWKEERKIKEKPNVASQIFEGFSVARRIDLS